MFYRKAALKTSGAQLGGRREEASPALYWKSKKKCPNFGKKRPDCVHLWVKFSIQNVVLRVPRRKNSNGVRFTFLKSMHTATLQMDDNIGSIIPVPRSQAHDEMDHPVRNFGVYYWEWLLCYYVLVKPKKNGNSTRLIRVHTNMLWIDTINLHNVNDF